MMMSVAGCHCVIFVNIEVLMSPREALSSVRPFRKEFQEIFFVFARERKT